MNLAHLSNDELLASLAAVIGSYNELTARLVAHLGEIEERRLHAIAGYSSMYEFCVKKLRLSESASLRRITAARAARKFPILFGMLETGAIHLSAIELLHKRLTPENHVELIEACAGKSKAEVEQTLACWFPAPDVQATIQKIPEAPELALEQRAQGASSSTPVEHSAPEQPRPRVQPLSAERYRVEFTASREVRDKLERALNLMSHANPKRDLALVVERGVDLLIAELEKKQFGKTDKPRRANANRKTKAGYVTRETRRAISERDGVPQCSYVSGDGHRCEAKAFLQVDHVTPRGQGGGDHIDNTRYLCQAHNLLEAERAYGREHVESRRHLRRRGCRDAARVESRPSPIADEILERVRRALTHMGFRPRQAKLAVVQVARSHASGTGPIPIETVLREALLVATGPGA